MCMCMGCLCLWAVFVGVALAWLVASSGPQHGSGMALVHIVVCVHMCSLISTLTLVGMY